MNGVVVRRVALVVLLASAAVWLALAGLPDVCAEQLPPISSTPVDVCEPMPVTDPRALLYFVLIGLLLLPELSELEVAGVLTVRRQVREAKDEMTDLKQELAFVRTEVLTAAAAANASASVVTHVDVQPERTTEVTRAIEESTGPDDGDFAEAAVVGAHAVSAFDAGFYGLTQFIPEQWPAAVLGGYVFNENDDLELFSVASHGDVSPDLMAAQEFDIPPPLTGTYLLGTGAYGWVLSAPARDDEGGVVGALVVRVVGQARRADDLVEDWSAQVELMAGTYARLLIDILGECPRDLPPGESPGEESQS